MHTDCLSFFTDEIIVLAHFTSTGAECDGGEIGSRDASASAAGVLGDCGVQLPGKCEHADGDEAATACSCETGDSDDDDRDR